MNKRGLLGFILLSSFLSFTPLLAADEESTETPAAPVVKKRTEAEEKLIQEKRKRIADKKTDLNGSSWDIVYTTSSDPKQKGKKDLFTFQNGQFNSKSLMDRGFTWTNYTISVPDEESDLAVWETMQTGKEGIVFIHGEWAKDKMSGSISEQLDGGKKTVEHSFSTANRTAISPTTEEGADPGAEVKPRSAENSAETSGGALVSKEKESVAEPVAIPAAVNEVKTKLEEAVKKPVVAAFEPGTTDEKI